MFAMTLSAVAETVRRRQSNQRENKKQRNKSHIMIRLPGLNLIYANDSSLFFCVYFNSIYLILSPYSVINFSLLDN